MHYSIRLFLTLFWHFDAWVFFAFPVENLLLGLTLESFRKFDISPGESSSLYLGTDGGGTRKLQTGRFLGDNLAWHCFVF